ncbi:MAG: zinc ABC transporter substrate-binding protein [Treponema sp.]|jgi:zinc transport system substrate-binding protein|nr:zinc ABC transporter substrate-binding protein [Treponema sp.]
MQFFCFPGAAPGFVFRLSLAVLAGLLVSCGGKTGAPGRAGDLPVLVVSILPQSYFASRIAGEGAEARARIMTLVGPGQNPHSYEPTPRQMADLAAAKAWVLSGTEFEIGLRPKVEALFPRLPLIDGTAGVRFRTLTAGEADRDGDAHDDGDRDDDGDARDDTHGDGIDRHTWLGHKPARLMAGHILAALYNIDSSGEAFYRKNYQELIADMDREFGELRGELSSLRGKVVFVYHPAFGYFLDEFGIIQEAVEIDGKEPSPRALNLLIERARRERPAAIFVQAQFPVNTAKTAADAVGAVLAPLDPLAPDWLANIRRMGAILRENAGGSH